MTRQRDFSRLFIALGLLAGVVAIAPIVAAVFGLGGASVAPRTAFASAPAGEYAVLSRSDGAADVIAVAWASNPSAITEVVRVPRLQGIPSTGAVSPDGKSLALVTADGGTPSHPIFSLTLVALESGRLLKAAENIAPGQMPVWSPDGSQVFFTRLLAGSEAQGPIALLRVKSNGKDEAAVREWNGVLGVYPVGFDASGSLASVVIDASGSWVHREGAEPVALSTNLTRDWEVSPDGLEIAYIDVVTTGGVQYLARTARLDGQGVSVQAAGMALPALGSAWNPATRDATFGVEPGAGEKAGVSVQALSVSGAPAEGFDVPLAYSESGGSLAVTHYPGNSFQAAGTPSLQLITPNGRAAFEGFTRFLGWSER